MQRIIGTSDSKRSGAARTARTVSRKGILSTMTTLTATRPVSKLYKRCAWGKHTSCPGSFETYSVCACVCHTGPAGADMADAISAGNKANADAAEAAYVERIETANAIAEAAAIVARPGPSFIPANPNPALARKLAAAKTRTVKSSAPRNAKGGRKCSVGGGWTWAACKVPANMATINAEGKAHRAPNPANFVGFPSRYEPSVGTIDGVLNRYANEDAAKAAAR